MVVFQKNIFILFIIFSCWNHTAYSDENSTNHADASDLTTTSLELSISDKTLELFNSNPPIPDDLNIKLGYRSFKKIITKEELDEIRKEKQKKYKHTHFIQDNISNVGMLQLITRYDHFGIAIGPQISNSVLFLRIRPEFTFSQPNWSMAIHAPIRLIAGQIIGFKPQIGNMLIYQDDWSDWRDWFKVIRYISYGHTGDKIHIALNSNYPLTSTYGMVLNHYQPNLNPTQNSTSFLAEGKTEFIDYQLQFSDITFRNTIASAHLFAKPLYFLDYHPILNTLSIGFEYVADLSAPNCVLSKQKQCISSYGNIAASNPYTGEVLDSTFTQSNKKGLFSTTTSKVQVIGLYTDARILYVQNKVDVKSYMGWHKFLNNNGGNAFSLGALWQFNAGHKYINAFSFQTEYRAFSQGFRPSYFDTMYETTKYQYIIDPKQRETSITKYQATFEKNKNLNSLMPSMNHGGKFEFSWSLYKESKNKKIFTLSTGFESTTSSYNNRFFTHIEFQGIKGIQLFGSYFTINAPKTSDLFKTFGQFKNNNMLLSGARLTMFGIMNLNLYYSYAGSLQQSAGTEYHIGNSSNMATPANLTKFSSPSSLLFKPVSTLWFELEIGLEF